MAAQGAAGGIDPSSLVFGGVKGVFASASKFQIDQFDPTSLQVLHSLVLQTRALPYRPTGEFGGKLRLSTTWYPGNPVATAQVFGPEETPTSFHGMWKDRFIATAVSDGTVSSDAPPAVFDGKTLDGAMKLAETCDIIRRQGLPLRVTWDQLVRIGYLTEFTFKPHRHQDIEWSMTFTWISQDDPDVPANPPNQPDLAGAYQALQSKLNALGSVMLQASDSISSALTLPEVKADADLINSLSLTAVFTAQDAVQAVNSDIDAISSGIGGISDTADNLVQAALTPVQAAQRVAALGGLVQASALDTRDQMEASAAQALYSPSQAAPGLLAEVQAWGTMTPGAAFAAKLAARTIKDAARELAYAAANQALLFLQSISQPDLIQAFIAQAGQDLRFVSTTFYGTPDEWISIMEFNNLTSSALSAGQVIFVPVRRAGS